MSIRKLTSFLLAGFLLIGLMAGCAKTDAPHTANNHTYRYDSTSEPGQGTDADRQPCHCRTF